jgi:hypothetical protein
MESFETQLTRAALTVALGDGSLYIAKCGPKKTPRVHIGLRHSVKQLPYMEHKVKHLKEFMPTKAKIHHIMGQSGFKNKKVYPMVHFGTSNKHLKAAYNILRPNGFKEITPALLSMLGVRAAAWFYMDDGYFDATNKRLEISMGSHSEDEIQLTIAWMEHLTGAHGVLAKRPYTWNNERRTERLLRMSGDHCKKFLDTIRDYSAPGMEYKFDY